MKRIEVQGAVATTPRSPSPSLGVGEASRIGGGKDQARLPTNAGVLSCVGVGRSVSVQCTRGVVGCMLLSTRCRANCEHMTVVGREMPDCLACRAGGGRNPEVAILETCGTAAVPGGYPDEGALQRISLARNGTGNGTAALPLSAASGTYRMCWCAGLCSTRTDFAVDFGAMLVVGGPTHREHTCVSGLACSLSLGGGATHASVLRCVDALMPPRIAAPLFRSRCTGSVRLTSERRARGARAARRRRPKAAPR